MSAEAAPEPFISIANANELASKSQAIRSLSGERLAVAQGSELQRLAYEAGLAVAQADGEEASQARARAQAISAVAKAWRECRQQVRIEQGKPNPGQFKPTAPAKSRKPPRQPRLVESPPTVPPASVSPDPTPEPPATPPVV